MGIMVYSLLWVMQDFVHQPHGEDMTCSRPGSEIPRTHGMAMNCLLGWFLDRPFSVCQA